MAAGPAYSPSILGTLGIAGGYAPIADLGRIDPTNDSDLRDTESVFVPFDGEHAIFEHFVTGTDTSCDQRGGRKSRNDRTADPVIQVAAEHRNGVVMTLRSPA